MKNRGIFKFLINPFTKVAGWKAFIIGLVILLFTGFIGTLSGTYFDGVIDIHISNKIDYYHSFLFIFISMASLILIMWIAGLIFSKNVRFVDILGTMTLAQFPLIFPAILGFIVDKQILLDIMTNPLALLESKLLIIYSILLIPFSIWNIILMYNAFKVCCNIKNPTNIVVFIMSLIIAEIISKILIFIFSNL